MAAVKMAVKTIKNLGLVKYMTLDKTLGIQPYLSQCLLLLRETANMKAFDRSLAPRVEDAVLLNI